MTDRKKAEKILNYIEEKFELMISSAYGAQIISGIESIIKNEPEYGKVYALTGATGTPCIANGNTWAESVVKQ